MYLKQKKNTLLKDNHILQQLLIIQTFFRGLYVSTAKSIIRLIGWKGNVTSLNVKQQKLDTTCSVLWINEWNN